MTAITDPLKIYGLIEFSDLEKRVKEKIGSNYSLDPVYQPRIKDGPQFFTPIRSFDLH